MLKKHFIIYKANIIGTLTENCRLIFYIQEFVSCSCSRFLDSSFELAVNPAFITVVLFEARLSSRDTLGKTQTIKLKMCLVLHHYWVCGYTVFTEARVIV